MKLTKNCLCVLRTYPDDGLDLILRGEGCSNRSSCSGLFMQVSLQLSSAQLACVQRSITDNATSCQTDQPTSNFLPTTRLRTVLAPSDSEKRSIINDIRVVRGEGKAEGRA